MYAPRIISDRIMLQEDFERLHKFLLEIEGLSEVSADMRELVEDEWPELAHKLRQRYLLGTDKDCAENCSPNCC
jgi:hypothetical protein